MEGVGGSAWGVGWRRNVGPFLSALKELKGSGGLLDPSQECLPIPYPGVFEIPGIFLPIGFHICDGL